VLVHEDDLAAAVTALDTVGLQLLGRVRPTEGAFLVGWDRESAHWVAFDLVTRLRFAGGRWELPVALRCLERSRLVDGERHLAPADELWLLVLHCLLDRGEVADRHRRRLMELARRVAGPGPVAAVLPPSAPAEELLRRAGSGDWSGAARLADAVRHSRTPELTHRRDVRRAARRLVRLPGRVWRQRGMTVALAGQDATGSLARALEEHFWFPTRRVPAGRGVAEAWRCSLTGLVHQAAGRFVVFDGYVLDAYRTAPSWQRVLGRWCPAPNLVLLLDDTGEGGAVRRASRVVRLDTGRPAAQVWVDAVDAVWQAYRARLARRGVTGSATRPPGAAVPRPRTAGPPAARRRARR
jgi:hypothetical protein